MHILRACRRMFFHSFHVTRRPWNNVCSVDILLSTFHLNFSLLRVVENFCPTIYLVLCIFAKPVQNFCTMPTIFLFLSLAGKLGLTNILVTAAKTEFSWQVKD